ncbi:MAG TPA: hypothetical protein ENH13_04705 [Euryarchaeota archaeon]|nr:hypothetical protein [Euryarchaeota archaeon]
MAGLICFCGAFLIDKAIRRCGGGTAVDIVVSVGAKNVGITGVDSWRSRLCLRISEKPIQGRANTAIIRMFSKALDVSEKDVRITAGKKSTLKTVEIDLDLEEVKAGLNRVLGID